MKCLLAGLAGLLPLALPAAAQDVTPLDQLTPAERLARRITPEVLVVRAATPAVVFIETETPRLYRDFWGRTFSRNNRSSGSGVVLTTDGFVVTNYHVVKDAKDIRISFEKSIDETVYEADLLSYEADEDLALLKIRNPENKVFGTVPIGTSSDLMIGEPVVAIGNPYGHTHTVSVGIISGLHRGIKIADPNLGLKFEFDDLIQTDASINPGNSGGPLLNINGELIGINNAVNQVAENIGFAIPIDRVKDVLEQQLISPDRYHAWLGLEVTEDEELRVTGVMPGGPAALAGLQPGDRLTGFGPAPFGGLEGYRLARLALRPGEETPVRLDRGGRSLTLPLQAWEKSDGVIYERLGVRVERLTFGRGGSTLQIADVRPEGPAARIGLEVGDQLAALRARVGGLAQPYRFRDRFNLAGFLDRLAPSQELDIEISRDGRLYQGTLELD
jgi:serine protease Do